MMPTAADAARTFLAGEDRLAVQVVGQPWHIAAFHDPGYVPQAHHKLISREVKRWADTPGGRLLITCPPQVGKSWTAIVWTSFWLLARDPTRRIIIACCTEELARYHGQDIRDRIAAYGHHYDVALKHGSNRSNHFFTTRGGYVRLVGVGGNTSGYPATHFLMDDLFRDWLDAASPTQQERRWLWAASVARARMQHAGRLLHVGTRWNEGDVAGRLTGRLPGRWRVLRLPAIADSPDDPLGRAVGDPLPKPGVDERDTATALADWEEAQAEVPWVVWQAMYQADPAPPGGALISAEDLEDLIDLDPAAQPVMRAVSVDPSVGAASEASGTDTGRQATFGVIAGYLADDDRVYLTHDRTKVMTPTEGCRVAMRLAYDTGAAQVLVEKNNGGESWRALMTAAWKELAAAGRVDGHMPRLVLHSAKGDKATRAEMTAQLMTADRVRFAAPLPKVAREWNAWRPDAPGADSPGRIDASGHLVLKLLPVRDVARSGAASPADSPLMRRAAEEAWPWRRYTQ